MAVAVNRNSRGLESWSRLERNVREPLRGKLFLGYRCRSTLQATITFGQEPHLWPLGPIQGRG